MSDDDNQELKSLAKVPTEVEAAILVAALGERDVSARAEGALTAGFRAEAPGDVRVLVHPEDFPRAQEILQALKEENQEIDWSQIDVGDPE